MADKFYEKQLKEGKITKKQFDYLKQNFPDAGKLEAKTVPTSQAKKYGVQTAIKMLEAEKPIEKAQSKQVKVKLPSKDVEKLIKSGRPSLQETAKGITQVKQSVFEKPKPEIISPASGKVEKAKKLEEERRFKFIEEVDDPESVFKTTLRASEIIERETDPYLDIIFGKRSPYKDPNIGRARTMVSEVLSTPGAIIETPEIIARSIVEPTLTAKRVIQSLNTEEGQIRASVNLAMSVIGIKGIRSPGVKTSPRISLTDVITKTFKEGESTTIGGRALAKVYSKDTKSGANLDIGFTLTQTGNDLKGALAGIVKRSDKTDIFVRGVTGTKRGKVYDVFTKGVDISKELDDITSVKSSSRKIQRTKFPERFKEAGITVRRGETSKDVSIRAQKGETLSLIKDGSLEFRKILSVSKERSIKPKVGKPLRGTASLYARRAVSEEGLTDALQKVIQRSIDEQLSKDIKIGRIRSPIYGRYSGYGQNSVNQTLSDIISRSGRKSIGKKSVGKKESMKSVYDLSIGSIQNQNNKDIRMTMVDVGSIYRTPTKSKTKLIPGYRLKSPNYGSPEYNYYKINVPFNNILYPERVSKKKKKKGKPGRYYSVFDYYEYLPSLSGIELGLKQKSIPLIPTGLNIRGLLK